MIRYRFTFITSFLALTLFILPAVTGCTPAKANTLQTAALQFSSQANVAIDAIALTTQREISPPDRSQVDADDEFVTLMLGLAAEVDPNDDTITIEQQLDALLTEETLEIAIDPYAIEPDAEFQQRMEKLIQLKAHYATFAEAFTDLDRGHLFASDAVNQAGPLARRLTVQMLHYAKVWSDAPPRLIQHRSALLNGFVNVLADDSLSPQEKRARLLALKERWLAMKDEEAALQQHVVEECLKAAALGRQVSHAIDQYNKLSLEDISFYLNLGIEQAAALSGRDLSDLQTQTNAVITQIREDPVWSDLTDMLLDSVN